MNRHLIPEDSYNHIEDVSCGCNPTISIAEGEEMYIHKVMDFEILRNMATRLEKNCNSLDPEYKEIVDKNFWNLI